MGIRFGNGICSESNETWASLRRTLEWSLRHQAVDPDSCTWERDSDSADGKKILRVYWERPVSQETCVHPGPSHQSTATGGMWCTDCGVQLRTFIEDEKARLIANGMPQAEADELFVDLT